MRCMYLTEVLVLTLLLILRQDNLLVDWNTNAVKVSIDLFANSM